MTKAISFYVSMILMLCFGAFAMAQAALPVEPTYLDGVIKWLQSLPVGSITIGIGFLAEVVLRVFPSVKPLSLLVALRYIFNGVIYILNFLNVNVLAPAITAFNVTKAP